MLAVLRSFLLLAIAVSAASVVHDRRASAPEGFVNTGSAPTSQMLTLRMNLVSSDLSTLEAKLMDAATPGTATFREWLSKEDVSLYYDYSEIVW